MVTFILCTLILRNTLPSLLPGACDPITKVNTRHILIISNFRQITRRYDNRKYRQRPCPSFGMPWLFFQRDRDIFPSQHGNGWLIQSVEIASPSQGALKANTTETRASCTTATCAILSYYALKDTLCRWQLNIWLAFHALCDIFFFQGNIQMNRRDFPGKKDLL